MPSDPTLRRAYNNINAAFFDNRLPDVELMWESCHGNLGETFEIVAIEETGGVADLGIRICPSIRWAKTMWKQTLLHEMCHVKLYPYLGHGDKFDREIQRLCTFKSYRKLL